MFINIWYDKLTGLWAVVIDRADGSHLRAFGFYKTLAEARKIKKQLLSIR
jgi:hypothetical protein